MAKRKNKRRSLPPDDYFAAGPFEFARFGRLLVGRSRASTEQQEAMQVGMAARLPAVVAEVDELVTSIADQVARLPPDRLLHRAWWELAALLVGVDGKDVGDSDRLVAMHMLGYVQSVIASVKPREPYAEHVSDGDWARLKQDVQSLFTQLASDYQWCVTADSRAQDPNLDMDQEEFRFRAETFWMNVRGKRYQPHERQALIDVLTPHSDVLIRLFGIDTTTLVSEIEKILAKSTYGVHEAFTDMDQLRESSLERMTQLAGQTGISNVDDLRSKIFEDPELDALRKKVTGEIAGLDLFDVEKITSLPGTLIDNLAWSPGEDEGFFAAGEFCGWPLRVWPTMKRPFIRLDGRVLCFDIFTLFDNFYRVVQRVVFRLAPDYKETWNARQKVASEQLPFTYLERLLPGARVFRPVYYRWKVDEGPSQWYEADGLLVYDDHLFVIEVKAGAFTYTSPATDLPAHIDSLQNLVHGPTSQGNRFIDYLESAAEVTIADANHDEIDRLRRADFRHVTVCAITLDPITELAARAQHLRSVGVEVGARSVWALSVDDLRVYADLFNNPLVFLHFVEQRMRAALSSLVDLNDEMDHVGLYIATNNYSRYAAELVNRKPGKLSFTGYSKPVDEYYSAIVRGEPSVPPKQRVPQRLAEIVEFLASSVTPGRSQLASLLLDADAHVRSRLAARIDQQLRESHELRRSRPISTYGEVRLTLFVWSSVAPRQRTIAVDHTRSVICANNEDSRFLIELEYTAENVLQHAHWQNVGLAGLSSAELDRLRAAGSNLREQRVLAVQRERKIGRNEPCPCGSRRKYKRCCQP